MSDSIISLGLTIREKALRVGHNPLDVEHERTGLENFQHLG